jgi:putative DNA methylase
MQKIIETRLPVQALTQSAIGDKVKKGHPGNLHPWWNRSPIASSAALLTAALEDAPQGPEAWRTTLAQLEEAAAGGKIHAPALPDTPVVCDPFAGFGGLVMAAQKLRLPVIASDLNPVAVVLTKAATEIPARFQGQPAVNPETDAIVTEGAAGLAADVAYYGEKLKKRVHDLLAEQYPMINIPGEEQPLPVFAWVWVRTMKCPNPACACEMPLASSFILNKTAGKEYWAEPVLKGGNISFQVHQGVCPEGKDGNKHGSRGARFVCPHCGSITQDEDVVQAGKNGQMGAQLMAVAVQTQAGRVFLAPDAVQKEAAASAHGETNLLGAIPHNPRWFAPPRFGFTQFAQLFTPRQFCFLDTLCEQLPSICKEAEQDAIKQQMADDGVPLAEKGKEALAYSQAIGVYLGLLISKLADFHGAFCTWDNRNGNIRSVFNRQALPMAWVFGEGNPFVHGPIGNFSTMLKNTVAAISALSVPYPAEVTQADALEIQFPGDSILFTELPYFDNVGYGELSDYFYVWLKKGLGAIYPSLFQQQETPKEEISSIPEHCAGNAAVAAEKYKEKVSALFAHFYPQVSQKFPSVVFFAYREATRESSFDFLLQGILDAGFMITGLWPIRTAISQKEDELIRVAVVFRKRETEGATGTRRGFINTLKHRLPAMLDMAFEEGLQEDEQQIIGLGMGLQIFTAFQKVINADGTLLTLSDALHFIEQETRDYCQAQAAERGGK